MASTEIQSSTTSTSARAAAIEQSLRTIIRGNDEVLRLALVSVLARGHLLIEGVPGVGKTTLAHALSRALDCSFQRIQFTSDMLPSDVLGISVFSASESQFEFKSGPIFTNVLLADEINRTTPKTQSALLEAMNEGQVTMDGNSHPLPQPFLVSPRRIPSSIMALIRCRSRSLTVFCCASAWATRRATMSVRFCALKPAQPAWIP